MADNYKPILNAFNDIIPPVSATQDTNTIGDGYMAPVPKSAGNFERVEHFEVGQGSETIKMDRQGLWMGAQTFEKARYKISTNGTVIYNDGINDRILIGEDPNAEGAN